MKDLLARAAAVASSQQAAVNMADGPEITSPAFPPPAAPVAPAPAPAPVAAAPAPASEVEIESEVEVLTPEPEPEEPEELDEFDPLPEPKPVVSAPPPAPFVPTRFVVDANMSGGRPSATGIMPAAGLVASSSTASGARTAINPMVGATLSGARTAVNPLVGGATGMNPRVTGVAPLVPGSQSAILKRAGTGKDPRAQTVIVPLRKGPSRIRQVMVKVMWVSAALMLLMVVGTGIYNLYLHYHNETEERETQMKRSSDTAELLDRLSAMESEIKAQRALIRQQQTELSATKAEMSTYARTNDSLLHRLTKQKAP